MWVPSDSSPWALLPNGICFACGKEAVGILKGYFAGSLSHQMGSPMADIPRSRVSTPLTHLQLEVAEWGLGRCVEIYG